MDVLQSIGTSILFWLAIGGIFLGVLKFLWPTIKKRFNLITPNEVYYGLVELFSELQDIKSHLGMPTSEEMDAMQTLEEAGWNFNKPQRTPED